MATNQNTPERSFSLNICQGCHVHKYVEKTERFFICYTCSKILSNIFTTSPIYMKNSCTVCRHEVFTQSFSQNFVCDSCKAQSGCTSCHGPLPLQKVFPDITQCGACLMLHCPECQGTSLRKKISVEQDSGRKQALFVCRENGCSGKIRAQSAFPWKKRDKIIRKKWINFKKIPKYSLNFWGK